MLRPTQSARRSGACRQREAGWRALCEAASSPARRASGQKWGGAGAGFELPPCWAWGYFQAPCQPKKGWRPRSRESRASPLGCSWEHLLQAPWLPNEIFFLNLWLKTVFNYPSLYGVCWCSGPIAATVLETEKVKRRKKTSAICAFCSAPNWTNGEFLMKLIKETLVLLTINNLSIPVFLRPKKLILLLISSKIT